MPQVKKGQHFLMGELYATPSSNSVNETAECGFAYRYTTLGMAAYSLHRGVGERKQDNRKGCPAVVWGSGSFRSVTPQRMNQVETFIYLLAYLRGEEPCHASDSNIAHSSWPYFCS